MTSTNPHRLRSRPHHRLAEHRTQARQHRSHMWRRSQCHLDSSRTRRQLHPRSLGCRTRLHKWPSTKCPAQERTFPCPPIRVVHRPHHIPHGRTRTHPHPRRTRMHRSAVEGISDHRPPQPSTEWRNRPPRHQYSLSPPTQTPGTRSLRCTGHCLLRRTAREIHGETPLHGLLP